MVSDKLVAEPGSPKSSKRLPSSAGPGPTERALQPDFAEWKSDDVLCDLPRFCKIWCDVDCHLAQILLNMEVVATDSGAMIFDPGDSPSSNPASHLRILRPQCCSIGYFQSAVTTGQDYIL